MLPSSLLDKSLQELEQSDWGDPTYDTHLVTTVHRLRRLPLRDFRTGDLRIMIGQNVGLRYLVPLAIQQLRQDPFAEGDFYPGDLLQSVLTVEREFWRDHKQWRAEVRDIAQRALTRLHSTPPGDGVSSDVVLKTLTQSWTLFEAAAHPV